MRTKIYYVFITIVAILCLLTGFGGLIQASAGEASSTSIGQVFIMILIGALGLMLLSLSLLAKSEVPAAKRLQKVIGYVAALFVIPLVLVGIFISFPNEEAVKTAYCHTVPAKNQSNLDDTPLIRDGISYIPQEMNVISECDSIFHVENLAKIYSTSAYNADTRHLNDKVIQVISVYMITIVFLITTAILVVIRTRSIAKK